MTEESSDDSGYGLFRHYSIVLDDAAYVDVDFSSNATKDVSGWSDTGREWFTVSYYNND